MTTGKGVAPPANINEIICDLYKNEITKNLDGTVSKYTCALA